MTYAEKIKAARLAAGITQEGMYEALRVPRRTVQEWESGGRVPPEYVQHLVLDKLASLAADPGDE